MHKLVFLDGIIFRGENNTVRIEILGSPELLSREIYVNSWVAMVYYGCSLHKQKSIVSFRFISLVPLLGST